MLRSPIANISLVSHPAQAVQAFCALAFSAVVLNAMNE